MLSPSTYAANDRYPNLFQKENPDIFAYTYVHIPYNKELHFAIMSTK